MKAALRLRERGQPNRSRPDYKPGGLPEHMHAEEMRGSHLKFPAHQTFLSISGGRMKAPM